MNELQVFQTADWKVRTIEKDGEPWFVAADVCKALEIINGRDAVTRLDEDEKGVALTDTLGGRQNITIVSEAGLYSLVLGSRKPEAKEFKRWITHEVLPAIRKTGSYRAPQGTQLLALAVLEAQKFIDGQAKQIEEMKPKAEYFDAVAESKSAIHLGDVAKNLDVPGMGRNNLFAFLREKGVLMADNMPYQEHLETLRFRVIQGHHLNPKTMSVDVTHTTLVYPKGIQFILGLLAKDGYQPRKVAS